MQNAYIDDLVEGMFDLLEGKEQHCEFDGVETVADAYYSQKCSGRMLITLTSGEVMELGIAKVE